ncbi:MAG: hemerythrin family [Geobacteraceae bacterium]|nr:MAG: hemerythrin family [Geobacteraceae bacterium]
MALLTWNDGYSVKVKQFDDQHKKLIDLVNQLHDAMKVGKGGQIIGDVLKALIDYTGTHFAAEERLMKLHSYPDYEAHKKEHNMLVMQVLDVQKKYQEGNAPITQNIMNFLKEWLVKHIQGDDKKYGPFLNGKGVV